MERFGSGITFDSRRSCTPGKVTDTEFTRLRVISRCDKIPTFNIEGMLAIGVM